VIGAIALFQILAELYRMKESQFNPSECKIPLDQPPLEILPQWGHWLETSEFMVAILPAGHFEVNLRSPLNLVVTSLGMTQGIAAFDSDRLRPYEALPGGFDIVPQHSTYRSVEDASCFIVFGYSQDFLTRIHDQEVELLPGQIAKTHWGLSAALAMQAFFSNGQIEDHFYLESVAIAVLGQIIYQRSTLSKQLKRPPEFLDPKLLRASLDYVRANLAADLSLNRIAEIAGYSSYHFARAFKATTGTTLHQYVLRCRVELAQKLLRDSSRTLAEIAIASGFNSQSHMTTIFRQMFNTTPKQYQKIFLAVD
jgi:AraC family transcriptional regulator